MPLCQGYLTCSWVAVVPCSAEEGASAEGKGENLSFLWVRMGAGKDAWIPGGG